MIFSLQMSKRTMQLQAYSSSDDSGSENDDEKRDVPTGKKKGKPLLNYIK